MKNKRLLSILLSTTLLTSIISTQFTMASSESFDVNISVNTKEDRTKISPYIYGTNFDDLSATVNSRRFGGNRLTAYNWENNASSAGSDWNQSSDNHLVNGLSSSKQNEPGAAVTDFHDTNIKNDIDYSLVTLQMAGYVAKDTNGTVNEWEKAPSNRWAEVKVSKGSSLSTTPNTNDNYVYMDEFVNFLVTKYGKSNTTKGIKGYSLDNEPALWSENHPRIHSNKVTCSELISKSVELSKALKKIDSNAETFGPALYGFSAYDSLQDASDWSQYKNNYDWFIDYYLDAMKKESDTAGKRLLDVLDLHWYSEVTVDDKKITDSQKTTDREIMKARVQAPRTFWDSSYKENSWIGQWRSEVLPLIPTVQESIDKYNPGTKLAFTEYNFGGGGDISGGISLADTLGIFGKYGVYLATLWPLSDKADELTYHNAAMNLYTNYDGKKSSYGDTNVKLDNSDTVNSSAYASIEGNDDSKAHIIVMNKDLDKAMNANISITSNSTYTKGTVYGFDKNNDTVVKLGTISNIKNNKFTYKLDEMSVIHIVLEGESSNTSVDENGIIDGGIYYIKNVNSGQYLDVYNGIDKNNTNIQQHPGNKLSAQQFKVVSTGDGYYKLVSQVGNGKRVVDVSGKKSTNGANIILYDDKESDNQKFKLEDLGDNKYLIRTKISKNKSVVEVKDASKAKKANVQQWEYNKHECQQWEFELVE